MSSLSGQVTFSIKPGQSGERFRQPSTASSLDPETLREAIYASR